MTQAPGWSDGAKRATDVVLASAGLIVTSPILAAVALAVRIDSKGPIFFRQERVGRGGKSFRIHKFRTMAHEAQGLAVSTSSDSRITRVGAVLRRSKIDELPQLLDVLVGEMSIVGPRPEVGKYAALWAPDVRECILSVRPGITDPASIRMRNEAELLAGQESPEDFYIRELLPLKSAMYVEYVQSRTWRGDLKIMGQTVKAVLRS